MILSIDREYRDTPANKKRQKSSHTSRNQSKFAESQVSYYNPRKEKALS
jgi:hypothetical protein